MKRDLVISFFAWPDSLAQRGVIMGGAWNNAPVVYNVGKKGNWDLSRLRDLGGGSILTGILNEAMRPSLANPAGVKEWGRVAILSFSEGTSGARQIMVNPADQQRLDAYISLDSAAVARSFVEWDAQGFGWRQYLDYGTLALDGSCLQVFLHTDITNKNPDVASTGDTAKKVFSALHATFDPINAELKRNGGVSFLDFAPGYHEERLNAGPRYFAPDRSTQVFVEDRIGNNFRIRLPSPIPYSDQCKTSGVCQGKDGNGKPIMVCDGGVGCAHTACAVDFARGILDTYLTPRWNNPEQYSCIGSDCLRSYITGTALSGFGDAQVVPTSRMVDNEALRADFDRLGLPRWDRINTGLAVGAAALLAGTATYLALKD